MEIEVRKKDVTMCGSMIKRRAVVGVSLVTVVVLSLGWDSPAQQNSLTISEIMQEAHKKPHELLKKVATGTASEQQKQRLVTLYRTLATLTPPQGDSKAWKEKTDLLVQAAEAAVQGKADAGKELAKAANCKACHQDHK